MAALGSCPPGAGASCMDTGMGWVSPLSLLPGHPMVLSKGCKACHLQWQQLWLPDPSRQRLVLSSVSSGVYFFPGGLAEAVSVQFGASQLRLPPPLPAELQEPWQSRSWQQSPAVCGGHVLLAGWAHVPRWSSIPASSCRESTLPSPASLQPSLEGSGWRQAAIAHLMCHTVTFRKVIHSSSVILGLGNQKYGLLLIFVSHTTE